MNCTRVAPLHLRRLRLVPLACLLGALTLSVGCGSTNAQQDSSGGAALGAIAGGILGGWEGAAIGAAAGGGLGYMAGNEKDKAAAQQQAQRDREAVQKSRVTSDPSTAYRPPKSSPLVGTTWRVISYVGEDEEDVESYSAIVVTFATNTRLNTLAMHADGRTETTVERYRLVEDSLIISGDSGGKRYVINGKLSTSDGEMVYVTPTSTTVLEEVTDGA